ncbi:MAG: hypothetical protein ACR2PA_04075 [Hyphomicrobiaceae bacterium]
MGFIKRPSLLTFLVALIAGVAGTLSHLGVAIPVVGGFGFWLVFAAYILLVLGCVLRGM